MHVLYVQYCTSCIYLLYMRIPKPPACVMASYGGRGALNVKRQALHSLLVRLDLAFAEMVGFLQYMAAVKTPRQLFRVRPSQTVGGCS